MYNIKSFNINNLINGTSHFVNRLLAVEEEWLTKVNCADCGDTQQTYRRICDKFAVENKWILMIDPDEYALENLLKSGDVDVSKILKIDTSKVSMSLEKIEDALLRGNCSAVVLPNQTSAALTSEHSKFSNSLSGTRTLSSNELHQLEKCALRGRTQCILVEKPALH